MTNWKLILAALGAAVIGVFVWSWDSRARALDAANAANAILQNNVQTLNSELALAHQAEQAAIDRLASAQKDQESINKIIGDIEHAKNSDNGAIAPVLRRTLDSLAKLRASTAAH